jgi:electron transfer flavoprotein beta subunit
LKIVVCVKQVPDTNLALVPKGSDIDRSHIFYTINPYDEFSLEEALRIKESLSDVEVIVLTVGPSQAEEVLRHGLGMGADSALHIVTENIILDPLVAARLIARVLPGLNSAIVFFGKQAIDDDAGQVGAAVAGILNWPQLCVVRRVQAAAGSVLVEKETEGAVEIIEAPYPVIITSQLGLNQPRFASVPGRLRAKKARIEKIMAASLGVELDPTVQVQSLTIPPTRPSGRMLGGSAAGQVKDLLGALKTQGLLP